MLDGFHKSPAENLMAINIINNRTYGARVQYITYILFSVQNL